MTTYFLKHIFLVWLLAIMLCSPLQGAEVRAVWLTTNGGLDWPSSVYDVPTQKKMLVEMLDRLQKANFNMIFFQVQANGDVAWNSALQPAMAALTGDGACGLRYDVCDFVISECHRRGMECHAWVVPFRLGSKNNIASYSANSVSHPAKSRARKCVSYKGISYLDPGEPDNIDYLINLYAEMVAGYDFDGISLDYTRYPAADFPDDKSFGKYNPAGLSRAEWRRGNLNRFVERLYTAVKRIRPSIVVGSAPIGAYKNVKDYRNATAFNDFFQDPVAWAASGHHDLIVPQMYWDEDFGFSDHMATWISEAKGCRMIVGLAPYKMLESGWDTDVVTGQIEKAVATPGVEGVCFFRASHVLGDNPKVKRLYRYLVEHAPAAGMSAANADVEECVEKFLQ